ncbi:MAG: hypothetical protein K2H73_09255 [Treponemataceae bacterium]|nr:hypothetical protein [Treponemataceae bacterium]
MTMKQKTIIAIAAFALVCAGASAQSAAEHYEIGDKGPGGGIVFYYSEAGFPVQDSDDANPVICHYLEYARKELKNVPWCPCGGCDIKTEDEIGAGKLNTARIINHSHGKPLTSSNCAAYAYAHYGTKTTKAGEWYLPSKLELHLLYENLRKSGKIASDAWHWSSSQYRYNVAWCQISDSQQDYDGKFGSGCARAVRAF